MIDYVYVLLVINKIHDTGGLGVVNTNIYTYRKTCPRHSTRLCKSSTNAVQWRAGADLPRGSQSDSGVFPTTE